MRKITPGFYVKKIKRKRPVSVVQSELLSLVDEYVSSSITDKIESLDAIIKKCSTFRAGEYRCHDRQGTELKMNIMFDDCLMDALKANHGVDILNEFGNVFKEELIKELLESGNYVR